MRLRHHLFPLVCTVLSLVATTGCASGRRLNSYLPIGAGAQYGNDTNDGVAFTLPLSEADAMARVRSAFASAGYAPDSVTRQLRTLRSGTLSLQGDTTLRISVQVTSLQPSATGSSLVITGEYSTPTGKHINRPVIQQAGTINPLFQRLREFANAIARQP